MKKIFVIIMCMAVSTIISAQPTPGGRPGDGGAGEHEGAEAPITTATLLLLGLGGAYTTFKMMKHKKE
ncbi:MAG: hypothetical protein LBO06_00805 [Bacteroidales bacterium]|jgi:hypothetical protein|nr:hypothetical protein [Bacteroidales bacterium]